MENPYENNYYQPYDPNFSPDPQRFQGSNGFATTSLIMAILAVLSICCLSPTMFIFAGLGILFSCLSKGEFSRPGTAKAGMAISTAFLAILTSFVVIVCAVFLSSYEGRTFLKEYIGLITSEETDTQDIYNFINKYLYEYNNQSPYSSDPGYGTPSYGDDDFNFYNDDLPDYYESEPDNNGDNFI